MEEVEKVKEIYLQLCGVLQNYTKDDNEKNFRILRKSIIKRIDAIDEFIENNFEQPQVLNFEKGKLLLTHLLSITPDNFSAEKSKKNYKNVDINFTELNTRADENSDDEPCYNKTKFSEKEVVYPVDKKEKKVKKIMKPPKANILSKKSSGFFNKKKENKPEKEEEKIIVLVPSTKLSKVNAERKPSIKSNKTHQTNISEISSKIKKSSSALLRDLSGSNFGKETSKSPSEKDKSLTKNENEFETPQLGAIKNNPQKIAQLKSNMSNKSFSLKQESSKKEDFFSPVRESKTSSRKIKSVITFKGKKTKNKRIFSLSSKVNQIKQNKLYNNKYTYKNRRYALISSLKNDSAYSEYVTSSESFYSEKEIFFEEEESSSSSSSLSVRKEISDVTIKLVLNEKQYEFLLREKAKNAFSMSLSQESK